MPLRILRISDLEKQGIERLQTLEPSIDASVYGSHILNLIRSAAYAIYPTTLIANDIFTDSFPQTATGDTLDNYFGVMENLPRVEASSATGDIVVFGTFGEAVPINTEFTYQNNTIRTTVTANVGTRTNNIVSIISNSGNALLTTDAPHGLPVGGKVTIVGSGNANFDGLRTITGATETTFNFTITNQNPLSTAAVGTITTDSVLIPAETIEIGFASNILGSVPIDGDFLAFTTIDGLIGGAEEESDAAYQARLVRTRGLLEGVFTKDQVELAALLVAGNTRAWAVSPDGTSGGVVGTAGYKPEAGQVMVYVVRDGDIPITPSAPILAQTKQSVIDFGVKPANTNDDDIFVVAPIIIPKTISINDLVPNTQSMKLAIESAIHAYMVDFIDFQGGITQSQLSGVISFTKDSSGASPSSFNVLDPSAPATDGVLYTFGGVVWG